jgi:hypothetical protein
VNLIRVSFPFFIHHLPDRRAALSETVPDDKQICIFLSGTVHWKMNDSTMKFSITDVSNGVNYFKYVSIFYKKLKYIKELAFVNYKSTGI